MENMIKLVAMATFVLLVGCKDKGHEFIGHWANVKDPENSYLDISFSDGIYHVDVSSFDPYLTLKVQTNKVEAQAMSETVLTIHTAFGGVDMRLEKDKIFFEHEVYKK